MIDPRENHEMCSNVPLRLPVSRCLLLPSIYSFIHSITLSVPYLIHHSLNHPFNSITLNLLSICDPLNYLLDSPLTLNNQFAAIDMQKICENHPHLTPYKLDIHSASFIQSSTLVLQAEPHIFRAHKHIEMNQANKRYLRR